MSLDASRLAGVLGPEIESQIRSALTLGPTPYPRLTQFSEALAQAIASKVLEEIVNHAEVSNAQTQANGTVTSLMGGGGIVVGYLTPTNVSGGNIT